MSESINLLRKQIRERQIAAILSMKAGRELDALIAEYIMELHVDKWNSDPDDPTDYWYRTSSSIHREDEEVERVPNYSTVLYSAEKIISKFKHWMIKADADGNGISAKFSVDDVSEGIQINACITIAEAICKAALVALVEKNRIIDQLMVD